MKYIFCFLLVNNLYLICFTQPQVISGKAQQFINSLNEKQQPQTLFPVSGSALFQWHYVPLTNRKGIALHELTGKQKSLAFDLLKDCLSENGFEKSMKIIKLESVLRELEGRPVNDRYRDPQNYRFVFFGNPAAGKAWCCRIEGHHLSFTFSFIGDRFLSGTPGFMGSNPAHFISPATSQTILWEETTGAFDLLHSFSNDQLAKAVEETQVPFDILTANHKTANISERKGISFAAMNKEQQQIFIRLVRVYIDRYTRLFASQMMQEVISAGLNNLIFTWIGAKEKAPGSPYYYRIQGPTLVIEFDNAQNNANHIHTVIRDLKNDFGGDLLQEHYRNHHQ